MSRLMDLVKGAAGEVSLGSRLGQWMLAVSKLVEAASSSGAAGYNIVLTTGSPVIYNAPGYVGFDQVVVPGILYNSATSTWVLKAGGLYELDAITKWESFGSPTDYIVLQWVNAVTHQPLVALGTRPTIIHGMTSLDNASSQPTCRVLYRPAADIPVQVWATPTGQASLSADSYAIVRQIG